MEGKIDTITQFVVWRLRQTSVDVQLRMQEVAAIAGLYYYQPDLANGATFLQPICEEAIPPHVKHNLQKDHIVSFRADVQIINEGLSTLSKKKGGRPVKEDLGMRPSSSTDRSESESIIATIGGDPPALVHDVVVVITFYKVIDEDASSLSRDMRSAQSAPA